MDHEIIKLSPGDFEKCGNIWEKCIMIGRKKKTDEKFLLFISV